MPSIPVKIGESVAVSADAVVSFDADANVQYRASLSVPAGSPVSRGVLRAYRNGDGLAPAIDANKDGQTYVDFSPYDESFSFTGGPASVRVVSLPSGVESASLTITRRNSWLKTFGGILATLKSYWPF